MTTKQSQGTLIVVAATPENAEDFYNLGNVKADSGECKTAEAYYNYALEIDPKFSNAYLGLGLIKFILKDYPG